MKNLKKVLALVVALTMVFTTVAFASYPDVDTDADYAGAVELLSALKVLQGDENGNFNPDNTITRAEFAAVVCRALGLEGSAASAKGATMFTDVAADHWASGYINLASQQGIVNGKGNGIFDPEGNVTYAEAVKMLVVAIGYEPMAATKGGYPAGYLSVANSTKMTAGVAGASDVAALRSTVAMLTANALEIPVMDQTAYGSETKYEPLDDYDNYTSLLTNMDVYKATGIITDVNLIDGEFDLDIKEPSDDFAFGWTNGYANAKDGNGNYDYLTAEIGTSNVADYKLESVDVYVQKSGRNDYVALIAVPSGIGETLTINATDLEATAATTSTSAKSTLEYYETVDADKTTKIYVEANPKILVNNVPTTVHNDANLTTVLKGYEAEITFIENTDDKYFDIIDIKIFEHAIVKEVNVDRNRIQFLDGVNKVSYDPEDENVIVKMYNAEGAEIELADIQAGDVLAMVVGDTLNAGYPKSARVFKEKIAIYNLGQSTVTGTLNQANEKEGYVYVDGVQYEYATSFVSEEQYSDLFDTNGTPTVYTDDEADLGTEGIFYLGMTGKIIGYEVTASAAGNYAFILQAENDTASSWDKCIQFKLLLADGTIKLYNVADDVEIGGVVKDYADGSQATALAAVIGGEYVNMIDHDSDPATAKVANPDAYKRVIEFATNSKDEITEIDFVMNDTDAAYSAVAGEFAANTVKVDGNRLASDVVIFNVDVTDMDDASVVDVATLVDEATYGGAVLMKKDSKYDIFVMTSGTVVFDPETPIYVVDSVVKSTYGDDKVESIEVSYYVNGTDEMATAIFTSDAELYKGTTTKYETLAKGSFFVANTAADGLVDKYAVIANVSGETLDVTNVKSVLAAIYPNDQEAGLTKGVDFIYGTIQKIEGGNIYIGATAVEAEGKDNVITPGSGAAMYYYNSEGSKDKLVAGDWYGDNVDIFENSVGNTVFARMYDGDVIEIIVFSNRAAAATTVSSK